NGLRPRTRGLLQPVAVFLHSSKPLVSDLADPVARPLDALEPQVDDVVREEDHPLDPSVLEPAQAGFALALHDVCGYRVLLAVVPEVAAEHLPRRRGELFQLLEVAFELREVGRLPRPHRDYVHELKVLVDALGVLEKARIECDPEVVVADALLDFSELV